MTLLYLWTIVSMMHSVPMRDWRYAGEYPSSAACHAAAAALVRQGAHRCISKLTGTES